jgi:multiple antibiotic resistance protein
MTYLESALVAFSTLVATVGPIETAVLFAALTPGVSKQRRRQIALKAILIATAILLFFALFGGPILHQLGVTLAALQASGGILLLLIALDMIFMPDTGMFTLSKDETLEAERKDDISVVPLATPIIAGPGAMGGVILAATKAGGDPIALSVIAATVLATMFATLLLFFGAGQIRHYMSDTAINVITRVMGIILAAMAMQYLFNGIEQSGIFERA